MSDAARYKASRCKHRILDYLDKHEYIMNADVRKLCKVSAATANRILAEMVSDSTLSKHHINGHWAYKQQKTVAVPRRPQQNH